MLGKGEVHKYVLRTLDLGSLLLAFLASTQGPVAQRVISPNPWLDFKWGFFFFLSNVFSQIIFSIVVRVFNRQIVNKNNSTEFAYSNLNAKSWYGT